LDYRVDVKAFKKAMVDSDLNIKGLSAKAEISTPAITGMLKGKLPSTMVVSKVAKALNLDSEKIGTIFFCSQLAETQE